MLRREEAEAILLAGLEGENEWQKAIDLEHNVKVTSTSLKR